LHRTEAGVTHFEMLTFWDDTDVIKQFAGDDFSMAKYYDFRRFGTDEECVGDRFFSV
jgi:hypothetical protein